MVLLEELAIGTQTVRSERRAGRPGQSAHVGAGAVSEPAKTRVFAGVTVIEQARGRKRDAAQALPPGYAFSHVRVGRVRVTSESGSVVLESGSFGMWDTSLPLSFEVLEPTQQTTFVFEERLFAQAFPQIWQGCLALTKQSPLHPLLSGFFNTLVSQLDSLPVAYHLATMAMARDLMLHASAAERAQQAAPSGPREVLTRQILEYIEQHLQNQTLSPAGVAKAHGISLRYLHLLFSARGLKVASWIRGRRLERCREALQSLDRSVTVTQIALSWGFSDTSHFSRLFRKTFGGAPNSYRRQIRARLPS